MKIHHLSDIHYRKTKKKQIMILKIKVLLTLKNMNLIKNKFTKKMKSMMIYFMFQKIISLINHVDIKNYKNLIHLEFLKTL
jgi:hypothetical protein